jgi:hypothetical protein
LLLLALSETNHLVTKKKKLHVEANSSPDMAGMHKRYFVFINVTDLCILQYVTRENMPLHIFNYHITLHIVTSTQKKNHIYFCQDSK